MLRPCVKRLPTAALLAYSQHVNRAHSSLRGRSSPFLPRRPSSERCPSCCCSSARRLRSSSFFTRNEKRRDRNARAASNLFAEADSAPRLAADVGLRRLLSLASRMEHERKGKGRGERKRRSCQSRTSAARPLPCCVRGKKERRGGGKREKIFAPRGTHRSRRGASEASSLT
jgi:hypothetical protein